MPASTWFTFAVRFAVSRNIQKLYILNNQSCNYSFKSQSITLVSTGGMAPNKNIFSGKTDRYHGITVQSDKEECSDCEFQKKLEGS